MPEEKDKEEEAEEENQKEEDPEVDPEKNKSAETRDQVKQQKFTQMLAAGEIPEWIARLWRSTKKFKHGKRDKQTLILLTACVIDRGRLIMNTDKAVFKNMRHVT